VIVALAAGCAEGVTETAEDAAPRALVPSVARSAQGTSQGAAGDEGRGARPPGAPFTAPAPVSPSPCRKGAFCDDFEVPEAATQWSSAVAREGLLDLAGPSASPGALALRARTRGPEGVAYLKLDGPPVGAHWVAVLAFSVRLDAAPVQRVGGPELVVIGRAGVARLGISVRPDGLALDQRADGGAARSALVAPTRSGEWRRVVVAVEAVDAATAPFGRVEVTVDDGELVTTPLVVAPFEGLLEVRAGVTDGDEAPATLRVDDLQFSLR
jgi:hypothetical protein